jgi:hypothetical protein
MAYLDFLAFGDVTSTLFDKLGPSTSAVLATGSLLAWGAWMFVQQHLLSKRAVNVKAEKAEIVQFFKERDQERALEYQERIKEFEERDDQRIKEFEVRDQERLGRLRECEDDRKKLRSQVVLLNRRVGDIERRERKQRRDSGPISEPDADADA